MRRSREERLRVETGGSRHHVGSSRGAGTPCRRGGVAAVDYVLVLGVVLPLVAFIMWAGPRIIRLAYEMVCVLVSWPFM